MMSMAEQLVNLHRIAPEVVLCVFGIAIMLIDPFLKPSGRRALGWTAFAGTLVALASIHVAIRSEGFAYDRLISTDNFSIFIHVLIILAAALAILGSIDYLDREGIQRGEYYALILFATAGMGILAGANELITAFIGLEMSSISSYILCGFRRKARESNEAAMKYFLLGSFATAFFLYGIAMIYGDTGTTYIDSAKTALERQMAAAGHVPALAILGLGLIFVGLGFKVVAAPFQVYAPDVYQGAPTPVTALLASAPKAATFALMVRIFYVSFHSASNTWFWVIWVSAILTMFIGNLGALVQTNVKRMLAYSSIAHAGYILVAFAASTELGVAAVLFYLAAYVLMKLGAFVVLTHLGQKGEQHLSLQDYSGLGMKQPALAACFSLFLLALLGLPATGGFFGKFFAFQGALDSASSHGTAVIVLVILAAINSVIGAYYYVRVIVAMYFWPKSTEYVPMRVSPAVTIVLIVAAVGTLYLGIVPGRVRSLAISAAHSLPVAQSGRRASRANASVILPSSRAAARN